jgi:hypothetical protein
LQDTSDDKQQQQQQKPQGKHKQRVSSMHYNLFALKEAQEQQKQQAQGMTVMPAGSEQASLPEGALSDPNEALNPSSRKRSRRVRSSSNTQLEQEQQQPDPQLQQLLMHFQPFAQSLQKIARQQQQQQQQQQALRSSNRGPSAQRAASDAEQELRSSSSSSSAGLPAQEHSGRQRQREQHIKAPGRTNRLLEIFGAQEPVPAPVADPLTTEPSQAKQAAQRLAQMIMQQQQARKRQQTQQPTDAAAAQEGTDADAAAAAAHAPDSSSAANPAGGTAGDVASPGQVLASAVPKTGTTRIYLPAPPLAQASSAADRQPLRLLSIRQQEQLRKEARAEAIRKVRRVAVLLSF